MAGDDQLVEVDRLLRAEPVEPEVVLTERFAALASHYLFEPCTCMQSGRKGPARKAATTANIADGLRSPPRKLS